MSERILINPSHHLWAALVEEGITFTEREREAYALGKLAILLELETHARIVEDVGGVTLDDRIRFTVSSALRSLQDSLRTSEGSTINDWYDALIARASSTVSDPGSTSLLLRDTDELYLEDTSSPLEAHDLPPERPTE